MLFQAFTIAQAILLGKVSVAGERLQVRVGLNSQWSRLGKFSFDCVFRHVQMMKARMVGGTGHIARMREVNNAYRILEKV
jgi:hypothetical protein